VKILQKVLGATFLTHTVDVIVLSGFCHRKPGSDAVVKKLTRAARELSAWRVVVWYQVTIVRLVSQIARD